MWSETVKNHGNIKKNGMVIRKDDMTRRKWKAV